MRISRPAFALALSLAAAPAAAGGAPFAEADGVRVVTTDENAAERPVAAEEPRVLRLRSNPAP